MTQAAALSAELTQTRPALKHSREAARGDLSNEIGRAAFLRQLPANSTWEQLPCGESGAYVDLAWNFAVMEPSEDPYVGDGRTLYEQILGEQAAAKKGSPSPRSRPPP